MGSGAYSGSVSALTKLVKEEVSVSIDRAVLNGDNSSFNFEGYMDNEGLQTGFEWREIGLFMEDPSNPSNEILLCYSNSGDASDYIPASSDERYEKHLTIQVAFSNATSITINAPDPSSIVGRTEFEEYKQQAEQSLETHTGNTDNPHSVTKEQVGLGNVPNVATNDQTPTYTEATTLTTLTSGEKLSVAFGKIKKAITELINHIANKENPHEVTKEQIGLGNVNNTSDANKPISTATQNALNGKLSNAVTVISNGTNLNTLTTFGFYRIGSNTNAQTLTNCPTENAFFMIVGQHAGTYQEIIEYNVSNPKRFMRNLYNSNWGQWYRIFSQADDPYGTQITALQENKMEKVAVYNDEGTQVVKKIDLGFKMLEEEGNVTKGQLIDRDTMGVLYPETTKERVIGLDEDLDAIYNGVLEGDGNMYSGRATDFGIDVAKVEGAYSQGSNPSPDNPQEMQAVEIGNLYSVGKNLLNNKNFKNESNGDTTGVATETGVTITGNYFVYYVIDNVPKNTDLYLSYTKSGAGRNLVSIYDNENFDNLITSKTDGSSISFNVGEYESIAIVFYCSNGTANTSTYSNIMLNVGSTAEPYTPYAGSDTVTLSEPLILRALPNGVCDTYEDGVITRRVGVVEFDGSSDEIWKYNNNFTYPYFVVELINGLSSGKPETILSNKLRCVNNASQAENWAGYEIARQIVIFNNELNIVEQFKTWLQSNPITVWYELATPTTEQLAIPTLQSFYPFTNAWCDSVVQPQQITWNVLTGKSSILDGNGNLIQQGYMTPQDNLLINSDFRSGIINQKGQTQYVHGSGSRTYGIDCWYVTGENSSMAINDKFLSLNLHNNGDFGCVLNINKDYENISPLRFKEI